MPWGDPAPALLGYEREIRRLTTELHRSERFIQVIRVKLGVEPGQSLMDAIDALEKRQSKCPCNTTNGCDNPGCDR